MKSTYNLQKWILIAISAALMFFGRYLPPVMGLSADGMQILCIFIGSLLLWLFVDTVWPSILCMIALCFCPLYKYSTVISGSWGNWIVAFLIFSNIVTSVLTKSGFLKRVAIWFITRPIAKKSPWLFLTLLFLSPMVIGAFMSPIPTFIVFLPIMEQIYAELGYQKGERFPAICTLGLLAASSFSTATTPIAHTFPILAMSLYQGDAGTSIDFLSYTAAGLAFGVVALIVMMLIFRFVFKPDLSRLQTLDSEKLKQNIGKVTTVEKLALADFMLVVLLWMAPGLLKYIAPTVANYINSFGTPVPAMIGTVLLFFVKVDDKPLLNFKETIGNGVPWGAIVLVAATMIISSALTNPDAGITAAFITLIEPVTKYVSGSVLVIIIIVLTAVLTNFISNTVAVTMFYSIAMPIVFANPQLGVNPAALASMIGAASCIAMATPPSTAHAALASGTGWLDTKTMLTHGMLLSIAAGLILALIAYPIAAALM